MTNYNHDMLEPQTEQYQYYTPDRTAKQGLEGFLNRVREAAQQAMIEPVEESTPPQSGPNQL